MRIEYLKRWALVVSLLAVLVAMLPSAGRAEAARLRLSVRRRNGADLMGRVAGTFNLSVATPEAVSGVTYFLDGQVVGRATEFPFTSPLNTEDYAKGEHELCAVARFTDGTVATSNRVSLDFRSRNWLLAMRQSMFLYAGVVLVLGVFGGLMVRRLMTIRPRLVLLDR